VDPLYVIAGLVALGVFAQWCAAKIHLPAIVVLLGVGVLIGPVSGLVDPDEVFADLLSPCVSLAVALILFEGGLSLRFAEVRKLGRPLFALVIGGLVLTFGMTTYLAHVLVELSWPTASVVGAILVITGPTVVKPLLRQAKLARRPALMLKWESIVNDPLGVLLAVIVLEIAVGGIDGVGSALVLIVCAGATGLASGGLLGRALLKGLIPEHLKTPAILAGCVAVFAGAEAMFHESGLLAVTIMGVVLANTPSPSIEGVRRFKEEVATVLVSMLFLVLAARLQLDDLKRIDIRLVLFIACVLVVVRPIVAGVSLLGSGLPWQERVFIGWIAPRGVVAAAMGGVLAPMMVDAGYDDAVMLVPLLFSVIIATVVLHGLTVGPVARALGLSGRGTGGLLIVGTSSWAIDLARLLTQEGIDAIVVDESFRNTVQARMRGVEAFHGDVRNEETLDELPMERVSWALAATQDDNFNALACVGMVGTFDRKQVLQLRAGAESATGESHLNGRMPWDGAVTFDELASRYWRDAHFKCTELRADEHDWEEFQALNEGALALFVLGPKGLAPIDKDSRPGDGDKIVYLPAP
jgi:NhaP-type Na+/H+ or K+/H+ antiporter